MNILVQADNAGEMFEALQDVIPLARRLGVRLDGPLAVLNPLVALAVSNPEHYDNVLYLVETKREAAGLAPLDPLRNAAEKFDKTEYQANFMQQKREREKRAAEIENMMRREQDRLVGKARLEFMQAQSAKWKRELDAKIITARAQSGAPGPDGKPSRIKKAQLDAIRRSHWDAIDRELDELLEYARSEQLKPAHQRKPRP